MISIYPEPGATPSPSSAGPIATDPIATARVELPLLGMHCSACASRIERALGKAQGVASANVNFATTRATVSFDPARTSPLELRQVVQKTGFDALLDASAEENSLDAGLDARQVISDVSINRAVASTEAEVKAKASPRLALRRKRWRTPKLRRGRANIGLRKRIFCWHSL